jgi:hypothetical protein
VSEKPPNKFSAIVHGISFYESMVAFSINRNLCIKSSAVCVGTEGIAAVEFWDADKLLVSPARTAFARAFLRRLGIERPVRAVYIKLNAAYCLLRVFLENQGLRKYF